MQKDVLVLKKEIESTTGWKPITVSTEVYNEVKNLSDETGMAVSKVAVKLLEFALEHVVIEK